MNGSAIASGDTSFTLVGEVSERLYLILQNFRIFPEGKYQINHIILTILNFFLSFCLSILGPSPFTPLDPSPKRNPHWTEIKR